MSTFQIQHTAETVQVTFDKNFFDDDEIMRILKYLRIEYLAKKLILARISSN